MNRSISVRTLLIVLGTAIFFFFGTAWVLYWDHICFLPFLSLYGNLPLIILFNTAYLFALTLLGLALWHCIPAVMRMKQKKSRALWIAFLAVWAGINIALVWYQAFSVLTDLNYSYSVELLYTALFTVSIVLAGGAWLLISHLRGRRKIAAESAN